MYFLIVQLCISELKPLFLVPGLMGSTLRGNITKQHHWYCPKEMNNKHLWFNTLYALPPFTNCILGSVQMRIDNFSKNILEYPGINLDIDDFGGINGISYVDSLFSIFKIIPYYKILINRIRKYGYKPNENLFGVPFDWRYGVILPDKFWNNFQKLVEKKVHKLGFKAILIGHSTGCFVIQQFLTKHTSPEWRQKYIDSTIFLAPSFGGSGVLPLVQQTRFLGYIRDLAQLIGGVALQMPNYDLIKNPISRDETGVLIKASDLKARLKKDGFLVGEKLDMFEKFEDVFSKAPEQMDVPTTIIYNTGLVTPLGKDGMGWLPFFSKGDGMLNSEGFERICQSWNNTKCFDLHSTNPFANHLSMIWLKRTSKIIMSHIQGKCISFNPNGNGNIFHSMLLFYLRYIKRAPEFVK